jgi:spore maturation protein CgeB
MLLASTASEVVEILTGMPEDRRLSIAEQARRRVLKDHTPDHRAQQLESYYTEALQARKQVPKRAEASPDMRAAET